MSASVHSIPPPDPATGATAARRDADNVKRSLGLDGRGRWGKRIKWLILLAVIGGVAFYFYNRASTPVPPPGFATTAVVKGDLTSTVTATGSLQPVRTVEIGAEISGRITAVEVKENSLVKAGQVLVRMDTELLEDQLEQAEASLAGATASVREARATLTEARLAEKRALALGKRGAASDSQVESAKATRARAQARVGSTLAQQRVAKAQVDNVRTNLGKAVIVSPIDGIVLSRQVEPGSTVAASFQAPVLMTIAEDLTQMELHLDVDEADVGVVAEGQVATFTVDAYPERSFDAQLVSLWFAPLEVSNVVTYRAVLTVDNPDAALRPGMTTTATIVTGEAKGVLTVPNAALRFKPSGASSSGRGRMMFGAQPPKVTKEMRERMAAMRGPKIWILKDGRPVPVPVELGRTDGQRTEVRSERLEEGAEVITGQEAASGEGGA